MLTPLRNLAWIAGAAWIGLVVARGRFWLPPADGLRPPLTEAAPAVHAVVPARDEADVVGRALASLAAQQYPGSFAVTLVDDNSTDGTGAIAAGIAGVRVLRGEPRPAGWAGKVWALAQGVAAARAAGGAPVYWWFSDADVTHAPDTLARLVATAEADRRALVSLMVQLDTATVWDALLIPAFVFFFAKLYPFAWSNDDRRATAAAAGGCVLIADDALRTIGGVERIRGALIDDCSLAAAVKASGGGLYLELSSTSHSVRPYGSLRSIWSMVARSAYTQLGYSPLRLAGTVAGMLLLYIVPPLAAVAGVLRRRGDVALSGAFGWLVMSGAYLSMVRRYGRPPLAALALPAAAALYTAMTVDSARRHVRGAGGAWKGRTYAYGDDSTLTSGRQ